MADDIYEIEFTQFLLPDGRRRLVKYESDQAAFEKWKELVKAGYRLETEILTTGDASFTVSDDKGDYDYLIVPNARTNRMIPTLLNAWIAGQNIDVLNRRRER